MNQSLNFVLFSFNRSVDLFLKHRVEEIEREFGLIAQFAAALEIALSPKIVCICNFIYLYVCTYVYMYMCVYVCMYVCYYANASLCTFGKSPL